MPLEYLEYFYSMQPFPRPHPRPQKDNEKLLFMYYDKVADHLWEQGLPTDVNQLEPEAAHEYNARKSFTIPLILADIAGIPLSAMGTWNDDIAFRDYERSERYGYEGTFRADLKLDAQLRDALTNWVEKLDYLNCSRLLRSFRNFIANPDVVLALYRNKDNIDVKGYLDDFTHAMLEFLQIMRQFLQHYDLKFLEATVERAMRNQWDKMKILKRETLEELGSLKIQFIIGLSIGNIPQALLDGEEIGGVKSGLLHYKGIPNKDLRRNLKATAERRYMIFSDHMLNRLERLRPPSSVQEVLAENGISRDIYGWPGM